MKTEQLLVLKDALEAQALSYRFGKNVYLCLQHLENRISFTTGVIGFKPWINSIRKNSEPSTTATDDVIHSEPTAADDVMRSDEPTATGDVIRTGSTTDDEPTSHDDAIRSELTTSDDVTPIRDSESEKIKIDFILNFGESSSSQPWDEIANHRILYSSCSQSPCFGGWQWAHSNTNILQLDYYNRLLQDHDSTLSFGR